MKVLPRRFLQILLANIVLFASFCVAGPALAATTVTCSLGGSFTVAGGILNQSTSNCAGAVVIPAEVTRISNWAFANRQLTSVSFEPNSQLTRIDAYAMEFSPITSLVLPTGLQSIGPGAFTQARFSTISIPGTVETIGQGAFQLNTDLLTAVFEPRTASSLTMDYRVFEGSSNLGSVTYSGPLVVNTELQRPKEKANLFWAGWSSSVDGPVVTFPLTVSASASVTLYPKWRAPVVSINDCSLGGTFRIVENVVTSSTNDCSGQITIPANVKEVGNSAFANDWSTRDISSVVFEANSQLETIGSNAFSNNNFSSIVIPPSVKTIRGAAFSYSKFSTITIPGTIENLEAGAFDRSQLETVTFATRVAANLSAGSAFANSWQLRSVSFAGPVQVPDLGEGGSGEGDRGNYNWTGWSTSPGGAIVTFPLTVASSTSITLYPKWTAKVIKVTDCSLGGSFRSVDNIITSSTEDCAGQITIPANVREIGGWGTFENRNITSVVFGENSQLTQIGYYAFKNTKFTSIDLPTGLRRIIGGAFQNTSLTSISIPGTVEYIEGSNFSDTPLETVVFEPRISTNLEIGQDAFTFNRLLRSITFTGPMTLNSAQFRNLKHAYNWTGWSSSEGGPIVSSPLTLADAESVTLYPNYTPNTYVVTFDATGGSNVAPGRAVGSQIDFPVSPTRAGYTFDAWFDSPNSWDWSRGPVARWDRDSDATLYAKWTPRTYAVSFDAKGGSNVSAGSFVTDGAISEAPSAPTRAGFSLVGWAATEDGTVVSFPYSPGVMENITLYAQWEKLAPVIETGPTPNSLVVTIWAGLSEAVIPTTANLPSIKLGLSGTGGTAVATVAPIVNPATSSSTPFEAGSAKIVDINITGITGSVTICIDGAPTDALFHFTGGKWEELPQRSYANGQVCGVTSSFSPFAAAPRKSADAPTNLLVTRGDKSLSISFTPGSNYGIEITRYEYSIDGGKTWAKVSGGDVKSPVVIAGLTNGTDYSVKLRAVNSVGSGADSAAVTGKPREALLADSAGTDVPIVKDPALTFALKSDVAVRGNKVAVALVAPTSAKNKVSYYVFTLKPKTKGTAIVKQTYKVKAKGATTAILTGKPNTSYTVSVTAMYANGSQKSWTGPSLATQ